MRSKLFLLAYVLVTIFSCKKSNESTPVTPPAVSNSSTTEVQLKLGGDFSITESPLGRRSKNADQHARTLNDSTIYVVEVRQGNSTVYRGVFNRPDSIFVQVPASRPVSIGVTVIRRGSGAGLYYSWDNNGHQYFPDPIRASLLNRMELANADDGTGTLAYIPVFDPADTTTFTQTQISEVDAYSGSVTLSSAGMPPVITIPVRRLTFGFRYNASGFTSGRLIADFNGMMPAKYLTPLDAASTNYIYTAADFYWVDTILEYAVDMTVKWEKPNGSIVVLGTAKMNFKRNVLVNVNVTIPTDGAGLSIPLDSSWISTEDVNF